MSEKYKGKIDETFATYSRRFLGSNELALKSRGSQMNGGAHLGESVGVKFWQNWRCPLVCILAPESKWQMTFQVLTVQITHCPVPETDHSLVLFDWMISTKLLFSVFLERPKEY